MIALSVLMDDFLSLTMDDFFFRGYFGLIDGTVPEYYLFAFPSLPHST